MAELSASKPLSLAVERAPKGTLQDHVHRQLSELILNGEIAPGQLVTIQALSDAFGVSAMPVREALQRLTAAKALTVISGRSIGIPPLNLDRLTDLKRVRIEVEGLAGQWAAPRITPDEMQQLEATLQVLAQAVETGDVKAYLRANRQFHFTIYRAAGSDVLLAMIESLWLQISPYFHMLHAAGNYAVANVQHTAMLEAIHRHDAGGLRAAIVADIEAAGTVLAGTLRGQGQA